MDPPELTVWRDLVHSCFMCNDAFLFKTEIMQYLQTVIYRSMTFADEGVFEEGQLKLVGMRHCHWAVQATGSKCNGAKPRQSDPGLS